MQIPFDEDVQDVIVSAHVENPRRIIHVFNRLTAMYLLAKKKEEEKLIQRGVITNNLPFLAKVSIIEEEWRNFYRNLFYDPFLLDEIEIYFRGMPSGKETPKNICTHFEENPGLRDFLNATRTVRSDDVKPFLLLSQGASESAIPELVPLRIYVIRNDVNQVQDILRKTPDNKKLDYVKVILRWCKVFVQCERYNYAFNCLNIVSYIYGTLPDEFHTEVAKEFGNYLDREGMRELLSLFNIDNLFEILPHMPEATRDNILCTLVGVLFSEDHLDSALLSKLMERSDLVGPEAKKKLNDLLIDMLKTEQPRIAVNIIQAILQNEPASRNLLEQRVFFELMEKIRKDECKRQRETDVYPARKVVVTPQVKKKKKSIPKEIHIRVMTPFDEETIVEISSDATVGELLEKAASKMRINPRNSAIMFQGEIVPSQEFLSDAGIEPEYPVYVVPKPRGVEPLG